MNRLLAVVTSLVVLAVAAGPGWCGPCKSCGNGCCKPETPSCTECCNVCKPVFHLEATQEKYKACVPVTQPDYEVKATVQDKDQPCTRCVPVCVKDPCTGCTHTEYVTETVVNKVKVTSVDITPLNKDCCPQTKFEERTKTCFCVTIDHTCVTEPKTVYDVGRLPCRRHIPLPSDCCCDTGH
jgi:hypothetical protein